MIRHTSLAAFNEIKENGLLSRRRWEVYEVLYNEGPLTGDVISKKVRTKYGNWGYSENVRNRLTEMRDMGVVFEVGEVASPLNGRMVILWDVTDKLPKKLVSPTKIKCEHCEGKGYFIQGALL